MEIFNKKEYIEKYRFENKDKTKVYNQQWRKDNSEYMKQWHKDNPEYRKQWNKNNPEYNKKCNKQWRIDNPEKIKKWKKNNSEKINEYLRQWMNKKYKTNLKFNLNYRMAIAIGVSLKGNKAGRKWESLVDYTLNDLKKRLKKTMPEGYNWNDFLRGKLHIDHIIPKSAFNFTKPEHIDFKRCWKLKNLRLLPAKENIIKSNKLNKPFQPALEI